MRKLLLTLVLLLLLTGCSRIPKNMDKRTYEIGSTALEIIHKYNHAEVSKEDVKSRINSLRDQLDALDLPEDKESKNLWVKIQLEQFIFQLSGSGSGDTDGVERTLKDLLA